MSFYSFNCIEFCTTLFALINLLVPSLFAVITFDMIVFANLQRILFFTKLAVNTYCCYLDVF